MMYGDVHGRHHWFFWVRLEKENDINIQFKFQLDAILVFEKMNFRWILGKGDKFNRTSFHNDFDSVYKGEKCKCLIILWSNYWWDTKKWNFKKTHAIIWSFKQRKKTWMDSCLGVTQAVTFGVEVDGVQNYLGNLLRILRVLQLFDGFGCQDFVTGFGFHAEFDMIRWFVGTKNG